MSPDEFLLNLFQIHHGVLNLSSESREYIHEEKQDGYPKHFISLSRPVDRGGKTAETLYSDFDAIPIATTEREQWSDGRIDSFPRSTYS